MNRRSRRAAAKLDDPRDNLAVLREELEELKTRVLHSWPALSPTTRLELNALWTSAGEQFTRISELTAIARANGRLVRGEDLYPIRSRLRGIRERVRKILEGING